MWRPQTWEEIETLIGQSEESAYLEFKRELVPNGREIAKDIAAMTVDGGVLLYGIEEEGGGRAGAIVKLALKGQEERIRQVAASTIHPAPGLEVVLLREAPSDADGVIVVVVPPSPLAPHEVDGRFPRRDGTTTKYLSEPEIERLYRLRRHASPPADDPSDLLAISEHLPGIDGEERWGAGRHVGLIRVAGRLAGDARHPDDPWLAASLARAAGRVDEWMAPRSSSGRPFLLRRMLRPDAWRAQGVGGWVAGLATTNGAVVQASESFAAVLRYPSHLLLQVTLPLSSSEEGSLTYACARERSVALEASAAFAFLGNWFGGFQAAGGCEVALELRGFGDAVSWQATQATPGLDVRNLPSAPPSIAEVIATTPAQLRESPDVLARRLLDRWLAPFYEGEDLFGHVFH